MLYPLKFIPVLKHTIWGGQNVCKFKNIYPVTDLVGESLEISGIEKDVSIVNNGLLKGNSLNELIETYREKLLGKSIFERIGTVFPLLIKFIDAKQSLSIQVHPNDELAKARGDSFGKTEIWYVVKATKNAFLYSGFRKEMNEKKYIQSLKDNTFINYLQKYLVKPGDVFFVPAGCVHAIGAGCFIVEIHQTSNATYRIYDYDRKDINGNLRSLHIEAAKDAINYKVYCSYLLNCLSNNKSTINLIQCSYFTINRIENEKNNQIYREHKDRFVIYICLQGEIRFSDKFCNTIELKKGETVLIPANNSEVINLFFKENSELLETYIEIS